MRPLNTLVKTQFFSQSALSAAISSLLIVGSFSGVAQAEINNKMTLPTLSNPAISAVLNGYYQSEVRALSELEKGFGLAETELALSANIDSHFYGKVTTILAQHEGATEVELEEAFLQTLAMPAGLSIRAGRFLSDIGYLNPQHLHTDQFLTRPALYRAFFGGHYFDDGLRFHHLAPTETYWLLGAEALRGNKLAASSYFEHEGEEKEIGVYTAYTKFGGDLGQSFAWQLGLNYLHNEYGEQRLEEHEEHDAEEMGEEGHIDEAHGHSHQAAYSGRSYYGVDAVLKWAPQGNYKYQHLTLSGEYFRVEDLAMHMAHDEHHEEEEHLEGEAGHDDEHDAALPDSMNGWYVSAVYQFAPQWSVGARYGQADLYELHGDHFDEQQLKETEVAFSWMPSHFSAVRLQYTRQQGTNFEGFEDDNVVSLQYIMTLGAHGAHQF